MPDEADEALKDYVENIFASLDEEIKDFAAERIMIDDKKGPVRITLKFNEDVTRLLKKKRLLKDSEEFADVFICPWLSKQQRRIDYNVRQLAKINPNIRFVGGLVKVKTKQNS